MGSLAFHIAANVLAFLSFAGVCLCLWRLRDSMFPAHLAAFALMLGGTFMREVVALYYGSMAWPEVAMGLSAAARVLKIAGAILFVRAVTQPKYGEWGWVAILASATLVAVAAI